uniref:GNAT family N-acetyltransferase n=1 Tax=Algoriphagus sp. TaxID=1872435 RepID=UPI00404874FF
MKMTRNINNASKDIILTPITKDHMTKTYEWISDPGFRKAFMVRGENSWERHVDYFDYLLRDDTQKGYAIFLGELHVGNCGFKYINNTEKSAELWIYIGSVGVRGVGLGRHALGMLLKNGTNSFGLTSVYVHVAESNESAKSLYKSHGFFEHGTCAEEWEGRDNNMLKMLWSAQ